MLVVSLADAHIYGIAIFNGGQSSKNGRQFSKNPLSFMMFGHVHIVKHAHEFLYIMMCHFRNESFCFEIWFEEKVFTIGAQHKAFETGIGNSCKLQAIYLNPTFSTTALMMYRSVTHSL